MLKQFNRFLFLALIVAAALYITLTNSDTATLKLGPQLTVSTYAGVIYIGVFAAGCIAASLIALFFGLKSYFRERKLRAQERLRQNFYKTQERARSLMAAGDWGAARALWEDVINRDPDAIVARVELSECLEQLGDLRESLRVLDATRASSRANIEVLFRAAQLNNQLGNRTAARDNLALILAQGPSHRALEIMRTTCEELGLFDEALKHHDELEGIGYRSEQSDVIRARLSLGKILQDETSPQDRKAALMTLLKRHPTYPPAFESLAEIERAQGNTDLCAEYLVKSARASGGEISSWRKVVELWLHSDRIDQRSRTEKALAAARSATKDTHGTSRLEAELLLIRTLLAVNHFQDAERALDGFQAVAQKETNGLTPEIAERLTIQRGYYLAQTGKANSTGPLWQELADPARAASRSAGISKGSDSVRSEPSPALSTP